MTKNIAVIGGGVVGSTATYYLSKDPNTRVTLFDEPTGQGTQASAGIINPWLSKRRNKDWYEMVRLGAAFYPDFLNDVLDGESIPNDIYQQVGTLLFTKKEKNLQELLEIGLKRRELAPEIGTLKILSPAEIKDLIPIYDKERSALYTSGGARVDGGKLVQLLQNIALQQGATLVPERVTLRKNETDQLEVQTSSEKLIFDYVVLATAAWLPEILEPLGYEVDIRPQKGQLVELQTNWETDQWPVIMPTGEKDIIPFRKGKILVGATHEDEAGFNLEFEQAELEAMVENARAQFSEELSVSDIATGRVGTRAYTSDFAPFFGPVPHLDHVFTASGLGSTGLTAGPIVGKGLSDLILGNEPVLAQERYPVTNYIKIQK